MKCKIRVLIIISIISIGYVVIFKNLSSNRDSDTTIKEYKIQNYILTKEDKKNLISRLEGNDIFTDYGNYIDSFAEVAVGRDTRDGRAWGTISLVFDKKIYDSISKLLIKLNKSKSKDSRGFNLIDEYGSIYINDYINIDNAAELIFAVDLPYRPNKKEKYNSHIDFFLKYVK